MISCLTKVIRQQGQDIITEVCLSSYWTRWAAGRSNNRTDSPESLSALPPHSIDDSNGIHHAALSPAADLLASFCNTLLLHQAHLRLYGFQDLGSVPNKTYAIGIRPLYIS